MGICGSDENTAGGNMLLFITTPLILNRMAAGQPGVWRRYSGMLAAGCLRILHILQCPNQSTAPTFPSWPFCCSLLTGSQLWWRWTHHGRGAPDSSRKRGDRERWRKPRGSQSTDQRTHHVFLLWASDLPPYFKTNVGSIYGFASAPAVADVLLDLEIMFYLDAFLWSR